MSLEWDYGYSTVLCDRSPGVSGVSFLDYAELGLSPELRARLSAWHEEIDRLSARWITDGPVTPEVETAERRSAAHKLALAYDVQHELGSDVELLVDGESLDERRRR